jgi:gluconolactonase
VNPIVPIDRFEVFATGLDHPECCAFDREGNCWAGGEAGQVYRIDPAGKVEQIASLGSFNGGVAVSPANEVFVCNPASGVVRIHRSGKHEIFASHAGDHKIACANFACFDPRGNMYLTDSGDWRKHNGYITRFTPDGRGQIIAGPFGYANGLALSRDEKQLFMVESDTNRVLRFRVDTMAMDTCADNVGRLPDGLAFDADGNLHATCYASDEIWRLGSMGEKQLFAHDPWAITLSRPTNLTFRDGFVYVANLGRYTIIRAKVAR